MQEACYCGRKGELEDRKPDLGPEGKEALRCPRCGHLEDLQWLAQDARELILTEAKLRWATRGPLAA